jgi:uncharacterized protein (TIGR02145 family)
MKTKLRLIALICLSIPFVLAGQDNETVLIGTQVWMTKNMNIDAGENHCYKDLMENCEKFGRLYDWETALIICPEGFRLPTDEDWTRLTTEVGGLNVAGYKLMMGGESGFNALLGGNYNGFSDIFSYQFRQGYYWTSTPFSETAAWMRHFESEKTNINRSTVAKHYYFSVRCIKE